MVTHRDMVYKKYGLDKSKSYSIAEWAKITGIPKRILDEVYRRGLGAHSSNLASVRLKDFTKNPDTRTFGKDDRLSAPQWASARLMSFINKGKTFKTADSDLAKLIN
jgi:hypothetical protein